MIVCLFAVTLPRRHFAELVPSLGGEDNLRGGVERSEVRKFVIFFSSSTAKANGFLVILILANVSNQG